MTVLIATLGTPDWRMRLPDAVQMWLGVTAWLAVSTAWSGGKLSAAPIDFAHDILPILQAHCAKCHTQGTYQGDISFDSREALLRSNGAVSGDSAGSLLIQRVTAIDADERMPPDSDPLAPDQITLLRMWIDQGLPWPAEITIKPRSRRADLAPRRPELPPARDGVTHPLDRILDEYYAQHDIEPPRLAEDSVFLRRLYLDVLGSLPAPAVLREFQRSDASRRDLLVVRAVLANRRAYADHWLVFWNDLLRNDYAGTRFIDGGRKQITSWLYASLVQNKPYDQFVKQLIDPTPDSEGFIHGIQWRGRVNASQKRQLQFAQNISQVLLGINMKCASCHDSFIDDWKLADAYGLAAIVSDEPLEIHRCDKPTGNFAEARFLFPDLGQIDPHWPREKRLEELARLMVHPENGRTPRTIVNRIWQRLMGRGIVHPVDVMDGEPWSEDLLDYLAVFLVDNNYDLKKVIELIVTSTAYRSASDPSESGSDYRFRGPLAKRMTAEQFLDAVWTITGAGPRAMDAAITPIQGKWIWSHANAYSSTPAGERLIMQRDFQVSGRVKSATAVITCDNEYELFVNGQRMAADSDWKTVERVDISAGLKSGTNRLRVIVQNGGTQANSAGFFCELRIQMRDGSQQIVASDRRWKWSPAGSAGSQSNHREGAHPWRAAAILKRQKYLGEAVTGRIQSALAALQWGDTTFTRASLMRNSPLMRSLGRPHREQVVSTRPEQLTTLQALDLSNGQELANILDQGAARLSPRVHRTTRDEFVTWLYQSALSRTPTLDELRIAGQLMGSPATEEGVADLLWSLFMLPEFQIVQ